MYLRLLLLFGHALADCQEVQTSWDFDSWFAMVIRTSCHPGNTNPTMKDQRPQCPCAPTETCNGPNGVVIVGDNTCGPKGPTKLCSWVDKDAHEAAFNLTLANLINIPTCASFCMYDYTYMVNTDEPSAADSNVNNAYEDGIGPIQYFLWRTGDFEQCWDWLSGSNSVCYPNNDERGDVATQFNEIAVCPTASPSKPPTKSPSTFPTLDPTSQPTLDPTLDPTAGPTFNPTAMPTLDPTLNPTLMPTWSQAPTESPTPAPTNMPTKDPTPSPTEGPTPGPTNSPTESPTPGPTQSPTAGPTLAPTICEDSNLGICLAERDNCWATDPELRERTHKACPVTCQTCDGVSQVPTSSPSKPPTRAPSRSPTSAPTECGDTLRDDGTPYLQCATFPYEQCYLPGYVGDNTRQYCKGLCGLCDDGTLKPTYTPTTGVPSSLSPSTSPTSSAPTRTPSLLVAPASESGGFPLWAIITILGIGGCIFLVIAARIIFPKNQILKVLTPRWKEPPMWWKKAVEDEKSKKTPGATQGEMYDNEMPSDFEEDYGEDGEPTMRNQTAGAPGEPGRINRNTGRTKSDMSGGNVVKGGTGAGYGENTNRSYNLQDMDSPRDQSQATSPLQGAKKGASGGQANGGDGAKASLWIVNRTNSGRIAIQAVAKNEKEGGDDGDNASNSAEPVKGGGGVEMADMGNGPDSPSVRAGGPDAEAVPNGDENLPEMAPQQNSGAMAGGGGPGMDQGFSSSPELAAAVAPDSDQNEL